jgi:hypothetical protein
VLWVGIVLMPIRIRIKLSVLIPIRSGTARTPSFTHVRKSEYMFNFYSQQCLSSLFTFLGSAIRVIIFFLSIFWTVYCNFLEKVSFSFEMDTHTDRQAVDADPNLAK